MSKVIVNESSLADIANAIREKNGTNDSYFPREMPDAIRNIESGGAAAVIESLDITSNGTYNAPTGIDGYSPITVNVPQDGSPPAEAFVISGNCAYRFARGGWDWFINMYGNQITTEEITEASYMFSNSKLTNIPFEINFNPIRDVISISYMFQGCRNLENVPKMNNLIVYNLSYLFDGCRMLKELPEDIETWFTWSKLDSMTSAYSGDSSFLFRDCYSLRSIPMDFLNHGNPSVNNSYTYFNNGFNGCSALDEIVGLPIPYYNVTWTSNAFRNAFPYCLRLKNMTFATPNGQPYVVNWKSQTIQLCDQVGWAGSDYNILNMNSGITADKEVYDDASYQALKDDPDWYTLDEDFSRYNHDSAVATINSLPDASAYLATAGGTNTITFNSRAGGRTDGGAIGSLTAEEIAVATTKGWTVSFV